MHSRSLSRRRVWMPATLLTALAACGGDPLASNGGATNLSVSFASAGVAARNAAGNAIVVGASGDTLVVSRVQLVLNDVELRRADVTTCPDTIPVSSNRERSSDDRGCSRLDLGPMLVDLPLDSTGTSKLAVAIPAGSYREIEFELDKVRTGSSASAAESLFVVAHPEFRDVTVRVTGTYRGTPFTFSSRVEAEVEFEFEPALVVEAGVNDNITVSLDLGRWFRNETGALLAPSTQNQSRIEQNIVTSFDAFGDRDRDGKEDRGRGRGRSRTSQP
jgi:hypothetical protein